MMDDLDDLLAGAKAASMQPSDALMARVLADAAAVQAQVAACGWRWRWCRARGGWRGLAAVFGGAGSLVGCRFGGGGGVVFRLCAARWHWARLRICGRALRSIRSI